MNNNSPDMTEVDAYAKKEYRHGYKNGYANGYRKGLRAQKGPKVTIVEGYVQRNLRAKQVRQSPDYIVPPLGSRYIGVSRTGQTNRPGYMFKVTCGPSRRSGFSREADAARAYDEIAYQRWGEDIVPGLNFPEEVERLREKFSHEN